MDTMIDLPLTDDGEFDLVTFLWGDLLREIEQQRIADLHAKSEC